MSKSQDFKITISLGVTEDMSIQDIEKLFDELIEKHAPNIQSWETEKIEFEETKPFV
jgi:hypothetical protein